MRIKRWWRRYRPRRKYIGLPDSAIAILSQLGYIELYRGEWFFTDAGVEALEEGIRILKEELINDPR